jgi:anti-sigma regulatory factor (Ser/Thr protein kinase)
VTVMTDDLEVGCRVQGGVTVAAVSGTLDLSGATRLLALLPQLTTTSRGVLVCDLSGLAPPDESYLLTVFPASQRHSGAWPRTALHLAAPAPGLAAQLYRLGMQRFLPIHATVHAGVQAAAADVAREHRDLVLEPDPSNGRTAREAMSGLWPETVDERCARQDGLLVLSELAANAAEHAGDAFTVSMALSAEEFLVGVTDSGRHRPIVRPIRTSAVDGRGMQLVAALSQQWGVRLVHERGKTVWAALDRRDAAADS